MLFLGYCSLAAYLNIYLHKDLMYTVNMKFPLKFNLFILLCDIVKWQRNHQVIVHFRK
jgi:hypothetical protein